MVSPFVDIADGFMHINVIGIARVKFDIPKYIHIDGQRTNCLRVNIFIDFIFYFCVVFWVSVWFHFLVTPRLKWTFGFTVGKCFFVIFIIFLHSNNFIE